MCASVSTVVGTEETAYPCVEHDTCTCLVRCNDLRLYCSSVYTCSLHSLQHEVLYIVHAV